MAQFYKFEFGIKACHLSRNKSLPLFGIGQGKRSKQTTVQLTVQQLTVELTAKSIHYDMRTIKWIFSKTVYAVS